MIDREVMQCLALHTLPGLSDSRLAGLFRCYGGVGEIWDSDYRRWQALGIDPAIARQFELLRNHWARYGASRAIESRMSLLQNVDAVVVPLTDPDYPPLLRTIHDPPPLLYVRGDPARLSLPQIAMVGSRKPSPAGRRAARWLSGEAPASGLAVCSGLALGIDGEAHAAALGQGGVSNAVLACGIDTVYPPRHRDLAHRLAGTGCVVSEFAPGVPPVAGRFPRRNRLISGLSLGVLVVEASRRSGSLITARLALEQNREVFALPWSVFHATGHGCLELLRDGAKVVETFADITAELGPLFAAQNNLGHGGSLQAVKNPETPVLSPVQREVLALMDTETTTADDLIARCARSPSDVLAALTALERAGMLERWAGGYCRVK